VSTAHTAKGLYSEVGRLRKVLVCRPGLAQKRLTPANCHELLFDDVLWVAQARNDHDAFTSALKERDVQVLDMHELLADIVALQPARQWLLELRDRVSLGDVVQGIPDVEWSGDADHL